MDTDRGFVRTIVLFQDASDEAAAVGVARMHAAGYLDTTIESIRTMKLTGSCFTREDFPADWEMEEITPDAPLGRIIRGRVIEVVPLSA